jgi:carboxypeptidase Taq (M32) metallopeptidase
MFSLLFPERRLGTDVAKLCFTSALRIRTADAKRSFADGTPHQKFGDEEKGDLESLDDDSSQGRFNRLFDWLQERVYRHGQRYTVPRLIEHAAGAAPDHQPLLAVLSRKYGELYRL